MPAWAGRPRLGAGLFRTAASLRVLLLWPVLLGSAAGQPAAALQREPQAQKQQQQQQQGREPPGRLIAHGAAALRLLSAPGEAERVAANSGWPSAGHMLKILRSDPHLKLDMERGFTYWEDPPVTEDEWDGGPPPQRRAPDGAGAGGAASIAAAAAALAAADEPPLDQALRLHSRPSAVYRVLMDFTGHVYTGATWGSSTTNPVATPAYDIDGDNATFSDEERRRIIAAWRGVAEDFSMFDVDITTEEEDPLPPGKLLGVRVCIGGTYTDWYGSNAVGGVAYPNSFGKLLYGSHEPEPVFVFSQNLIKQGDNHFNASSGKPKFINEVTSHEVGHTFGLSHDGLFNGTGQPTEYYRGHGVWAPIMGTAYSRPVSQWSKGEYLYATNQEDDLMLIDNYLDYITDDHGDSPDAATALRGTDMIRGGIVALRGVIGRTNDSDWFSFWARPGRLDVGLALLDCPAVQGMSAAEGWGVAGSDLNAVVSLVGPGNVTQQWSANEGLLCGNWNVTINESGYHYLEVKGAGQGADASVGFSSYGSVGSYVLSLSGDWPPPSLDCKSSPVTVKLPFAGQDDCSGGTLPVGAYYSASSPVTVSPKPPERFKPGDAFNFTVSDESFGFTCDVRVEVVPCAPPACKLGPSAPAVQLPFGGGGGCKAAAIEKEVLYEGGGVSVEPPLPDLFVPGSYNFTATNVAGSCQIQFDVAACVPLACKWNSSVPIQLPRPGGNCSGAVVTSRELFEGWDATVAPQLPALFQPGDYSFIVCNSTGGTCRLAVSVLPCIPLECKWDSGALIQLPQEGGSCGGAVVDAGLLYQGTGIGSDPPLPGIFPPGNWSFNLSDHNSSCGITVQVAPCAPCRQMRIKVEGFQRTPVGRSGLWRVINATLRVTDGNGEEVPGVAVSYSWSSIPRNATLRPMFATRQARAVTGRLPRTRGAVTLASRPARVGDVIRLAITEVARTRDAAACDWLPGASDAVTNFTCAEAAPGGGGGGAAPRQCVR